MANTYILFLICLHSLSNAQEEDTCDGVKCAANEICEVALCRVSCSGDDLCPEFPCGSYCASVPETTQTTVSATLESEYCGGVTCPAGQICQVATCTPMCLDEDEPCPHLPCGSYCAPAPETSSQTTVTEGEETCEGEICTPEQVCQEMYCTPYCPEDDPEPCPREVCAKMCIPREEATSTILTPSENP
ncbi:hypothetical protein L9F63_006000 [Diploptera punctata]|uniref:Uncharacterized protein n=1 Tax=Diploptera punctata TaxID=6984 RepID=A0AAD7ZB54_DIPPU|nr:hypothetical protein L9F63_006000 [Diploptera punctata]